MIYKKFLCCVSLFFLSSCASMTKTTPTPAQLQDVVSKLQQFTETGDEIPF